MSSTAEVQLVERRKQPHARILTLVTLIHWRGPARNPEPGLQLMAPFRYTKCAYWQQIHLGGFATGRHAEAIMDDAIPNTTITFFILSIIFLILYRVFAGGSSSLCEEHFSKCADNIFSSRRVR